jgi:septum site-determining protein MinC
MHAKRSETDVAGAPEPIALPQSRIDPAAPAVTIRGRSVLALVLTPAPPLEAWLAGLDQQLARTPDLFADRPIVADLSDIAGDGVWPAPCVGALGALAARNLKLVGLEGVSPELLRETPWARLPTALRGREAPQDPNRRAPAGASPPAPARTLLIDRPVRSGQTILNENGDVTIVGAVASGAEIIAGGSIHIYGPLRGRAIAGGRSDQRARIFCRALEAELVAIGGIYRTADSWGDDVQGRAVQISAEGRTLKLTVLE